MVRHASVQHRKSKRPSVGDGTEGAGSSTGGTGFIGFGAFATASVGLPAVDVRPTDTAAPSAPSVEGTNASVGIVVWNPVYTGPDSTYRNLFARIAQKRDALTVHKALGDLQDHISNESIHKRITAEAILHYAWLYHSKLAWSDAAIIRASALRVWITAVHRVPKAVASIISNTSHGELLGLWYAAHSDPAREVRSVATATEATALYQSTTNNENNWPWQEGILTLVSRLLSYGRARSLYDVIHPPRTTTTSGSKAENAAEASDPSTLEHQRDTMEELYVRIVGNCLDCCRSWLEHQASSSSGITLMNSIDPTQTTLWWSLITNYQKHYPGLRRKSYHLLAVVASTVPRLMPSRLSILLPQIVSSEKEAANLPLLLETLLTIVANQRPPELGPTRDEGAGDESKDNDNKPSDTNFTDTARLLLPPLTKLLQKACYGAKVETWGPILLPLVAQLGKTFAGDDNDHLHVAWQLLRATADGASRTLGASDPFHLWAAVAECASFCLVKANTTTPTRDVAIVTDPVGDGPNSAVKLAQLWVDAFQFLTTTTTLTHTQRADGPTAIAKTRLTQDLATQLIRIESASDRPQTIIYDISDWFWSTAFVWSESSHPAVLAQFFNELARLKISSASTISSGRPLHELAARLAPELQKCFTRTLQQYQTSSSVVPNEDDYGLMRSMFEFSGPLTVLAISGDADSTNDQSLYSLDSFVMNELLRWSVIHTSLLPTNQRHEQSNALVEFDFVLLYYCMNSIASKDKRTKLWSAFIREIVAAKCDLGFLAFGLATLTRRALLSSDADWIRGDVLDTFAQDMTGTCVSHFMDDESQAVTVARGKKLEFYRTCLGLSSGPEGIAIVGSGVIDKWIDHVGVPLSTQPHPANYHADNAVVEALLQTIQVQRQVLGVEKSLRVMLAAWCIGDPLFETYARDILTANPTLQSEVETATSNALCNDLAACLVEVCSASTVHAWALRAARVYRLFKDDILTRSLPLGVEDVNLWRNHSSAMFRFVMALFDHIPDDSDRLALVESWDRSNTAKMLVDVLVTLSDASNDFFRSVRSRDMTDRCAQFLLAVGMKTSAESRVEGLLKAVIQGLGRALRQSPVLDSEVRPRVAVMSQLLEFVFGRIQYTDGSLLTTEDVRGGDTVWYIVDPNICEERREAEVLKVHYDAQAGYFYSIRVIGDEGVQERQTVIERLRKYPPRVESSQQGILVSAITDNEWTSRASYRDLIWNQLISPFVSSATHEALISELVHVVLSQVGVGKNRGIGSVHYEIHQFVVRLEQRIHASIDADLIGASQTLWSLATVLGFDFNTPMPVSTIGMLRFDPIPLTTRLMSACENQDCGGNSDIECATLVYLIGSGIDSSAVLNQNNHPLIFLFNTAASVLEREQSQTLNGSVIVAARAIYEGVQRSSRKLDGAWDDLEMAKVQMKSFLCLIRIFVSCRSSDSESGCTEPSPIDWTSMFALPQLIRVALSDSKLRRAIAEAASSVNAGELCKALFSPAKRYISFLLLDFLARRDKPLQTDEVVVADSTTVRLRSWLAGMNEEEAAIVEEDVFIVAEWVPSTIMTEIESWEDAEFEMHDRSIIVGRLLTWFCFLRFVDASTPVDFRNRPAFVSYLSKCGAVSSILNLGVLHNEIVNDHKRKITPTLLEVDDLLHDEGFSDLSQLATLSLFRTVEVFPSLSRRWWEDDCPKVYANAVQSLVEKYVAPAILKRELERIKQATSFGLMTVTASQASRAVTATYEQDDFKLRVLIALPPAFPFRNAEVDCTKTLGVPQNRRERWSLQITMMLNNQGGTLQDALMLWKDNVDKEFDGLEPCPVCYSVLHVKTHKLPSLECKVCHNRFHLECLSQWFRSSGKSQCVLCQSPWQGTRIQ